MTANNLKGNLTTIAVWFWMLVSPYIAQYVTQDQFVTLFVAIVGIALAIVSSYYPNTFAFLDNDNMTVNEDIAEMFGLNVLNDEYGVEFDDSEE